MVEHTQTHTEGHYALRDTQRYHRHASGHTERERERERE